MGGTGRKMLVYGAGLIALYIVVYKSSNAGQLFTTGGPQVSGLVRTLQGR